MDRNNEAALRVDDLGVKEKIPKRFIVSSPQEECKHGVKYIDYYIEKESKNEMITSFRIYGECICDLKRNVVLMFLVYNEQGELIEANFKQGYEKETFGKQTFSLNIDIPTDEYISKVVFKVIYDPETLETVSEFLTEKLMRYF